MVLVVHLSGTRNRSIHASVLTAIVCVGFIAAFAKHEQDKYRVAM